MNRRETLCAAAAALGLSGCLGELRTGTASSPQPSDTTTDTEDNSETELPSSDVLFSPSIRYIQNNDSIGVDNPTKAQFCFVKMPQETGFPAPEDVELVVESGKFDPVTDIPGFRVEMPDISQVYTESGGDGWLLFDIPVVDSSTGFLEYNNTQYKIPEDKLVPMSSLPDITMESVSFPDVVEGGSFTVTVEVSNSGEQNGRFLAGFNRDGGFETIEPEIGPDGTSISTVELQIAADSGEKDRFGFVYPDGFENYTVTVRS